MNRKIVIQKLLENKNAFQIPFENVLNESITKLKDAEVTFEEIVTSGESPYIDLISDLEDFEKHLKNIIQNIWKCFRVLEIYSEIMQSIPEENLQESFNHFLNCIGSIVDKKYGGQSEHYLESIINELDNIHEKVKDESSLTEIEYLELVESELTFIEQLIEFLKAFEISEKMMMGEIIKAYNNSEVDALVAVSYSYYLDNAIEKFINSLRILDSVSTNDLRKLFDFSIARKYKIVSREQKSFTYIVTKIIDNY